MICYATIVTGIEDKTYDERNTFEEKSFVTLMFLEKNVLWNKD